MEFCDLDCKYATFPESDVVDGSRSCRTFIALYCTRKKKLVHKNLPCNDKIERNGGSTEPRRSAKVQRAKTKNIKR